MKITINRFSVICLLSMLYSGSSLAELFVNPIGNTGMGAKEISAHFGTSEVEYEFDGGGSGDVERTFLGATITFGNSATMDWFATFSYTLEAEIEGLPDDDTGFIFGGGVRSKLKSSPDMNVHGYGQLLLIDEDYTSGVSGEETSIMLGVAAAKGLSPEFVGYAAFELNLYSDAEVEGFDFERDDLFGVRVGGNYDMGNFMLNFNLSLIHESGFFISGSKPF